MNGRVRLRRCIIQEASESPLNMPHKFRLHGGGGGGGGGARLYLLSKTHEAIAN
jgi:hypothetical protein